MNPAPISPVVYQIYSQRFSASEIPLLFKGWKEKVVHAGEYTRVESEQGDVALVFKKGSMRIERNGINKHTSLPKTVGSFIHRVHDRGEQDILCWADHIEEQLAPINEAITNSIQHE